MEKKYWLIRGQRIAQQILQETTYAELERNTLNFTPTSQKRQHAVNPIQINQLRLISYPSNNMLGVDSIAHSDSGQQYQPQMLFNEVEFVDTSEETVNSPEYVTFMAIDGKEYTIRPIQLIKNNVKVRCTCLDFRWRFAIYNEKDGSLYGRGPGLYHKKTDRPPNNPQGVPGLCKHLLKLAVELKNNRLVQ